MASPVPRRPSDAAPLRPAATVLLLRPSADGTPEVLMLRRHGRSGFAANVWVFPGGVVDERDGDVPPQRIDGLDAGREAARLGWDAGRLTTYAVAAARETFEEAGVLLARDAAGRPVDTARDDVVALRAALNERGSDADFTAWLADEDLTLELGSLTPWLRWVTPIQEPKRFDTLFFLATMPEGAIARHDDIETTETRWITAADALAAGGDFPVIFPTARTLGWMAAHDTLAALRAHAAGLATIEPLQPHIFTDEEGRYTGIVLPEDEGFPHEVYR